MADDKLDQSLQTLQINIHRDVAAGFSQPEDIVRNAVEVATDDCQNANLRQHADRLLRQAIDLHLKEEASWPAVTDFDRFQAAFDALEDQGIVCRHNFSCCGTCAAGEIWTEIDAERKHGREIIGCAHYNIQDTESAVEGHGIYLSYSSVLRGERPSVEIGHRIAQATRDQGLEVKWDGTLAHRIFVALDWKRRLPDTLRHFH